MSLIAIVSSLHFVGSKIRYPRLASLLNLTSGNPGLLDDLRICVSLQPFS